MQLSRSAYERAAEFIRTQARPLERARFARAFEDAPPGPALAALATFQNSDGGFGRALEPDFRLPDSSALATSHALTVARELCASGSHALVEGGLAWLESHVDPSIPGWRAVPPEVDAHPHADHWSYALHAPDGPWPVIAIPLAEAISHFYHFRGALPPELAAAPERLIDALPELAAGSDGVVYLDRLARTDGLPARLAEALGRHLPRIALGMLSRDPDEWSDYVAKPLKLAPTPASRLADTFPDDVARNLDYEIERQQPDGSWLPNWSWKEYPDDWPVARREWQGILTLETLESLRAWKRLA